mmetsp:Transcript_326/g.373  ORF Transcript_326/g.373 Transcript_326/m.373 type:complete len:266 (-) Transcript_326:2246-3043(-)
MELNWLVGIGAAATLGALVYYLSDDGKSASVDSSSVTREKLLEVLRDLKKETIISFITIASFAQNVKQSNPQVGEEDLKALLVEYSPFKEIISKAEAKVYDKHDVVQADIQRAYENEFSGDAEVQHFVVEMRENLELSFKGVQPVYNAELPDFFTPDFTLRLVATMFESNKLIVKSIMTKLQREGVRPSKNDPRFVEATKDMEEAFEMAKEHIFQKNGLNELEDPATLVFNTAIQKFTKETKGFKASYDALEGDYRNTLQAVFSG